ncbi:MAG TPA: HPP family protein [Bryobacteraceae bacterium]|nr:HPP family protein [Bryobacteraceae bacterium]
MALHDPSAGPPAIPAHELQHVVGLFERAGAGRVVRPLPAPVVWAVYVFVNGFITIGLLALVAVVTGVPFVFPSLGPTAYLLFFSPRAEASSPHNTLVGHAIGLACGYGAYRLAGLRYPGAPAVHGLDWPRIVAAALSLAATGALMILLKASHPPAGATTLIVSLGIIARPAYLVVIEAAVVLLTAQAFCINRLSGVRYPVWKARR